MVGRMHRKATGLTLAAAAVVLCAAPRAAQATPRVGVVVLSLEALTEEQGDELAYDVAAAVAQRIEGDAIAGPTVRGLIPDGVPAGCEDQAVCGRRIAARLKTDEVLFLVIKKSGKRDLDLALHRIARDPERIPTDQTVHLAGGLKARRDKPLADAAAALYAPGSVAEWVEPEAAPPPPDPVVVEDRARRARATQKAGEPVTHRAWFWPVVIGGAVVVVGGVIALTVWETRPGPTGTPITLP